MDYEINWSPEALEDTEEIARYIQKDSPRYAGIVVDKLIEASRTLTSSPQRGCVVPELGLEDYREIFIYSYRLIYRMTQRSILVVAVIHGRRLLMDAIVDRMPANDT
jgi:addiction module RelE/StbE family toxin